MRIVERPIKAYQKHAGDYLGWPKDFYVTLLLSFYAGLQLIISIIGNLVFLE